MKKIMIILGVIATAMVTNAAAIQWQVTAGPNANRLFDHTGTAAFKGTAYLILASDAATIKASLDSAAKSIGDATTYGSTSTFNATTGAMSAALNSADTLTATEQAFQILLVETSGSDVWYKFSDSKVATPSTDLVGNPVKVQWAGNSNFAGSFTQAGSSAAPEPTSGLLLLLGMAGLALKRKVA